MSTPVMTKYPLFGVSTPPVVDEEAESLALALKLQAEANEEDERLKNERLQREAQATTMKVLEQTLEAASDVEDPASEGPVLDAEEVQGTEDDI